MTATPVPVLVGCSHGTDNLEGRAAIATILADVARTRPDLDVREAFVDVQQPELPDVVTGALRDAPAVVVPLLLSTGFHVKTDVAEAVDRPGAAAGRPMGPDLRLVEILAERLAAAGLRPDDAVVVAAAGSSDPDAATAVREVVAGLAARLGRPVTVGYGSGAHPRVPVAVADARAGLGAAGRVVVASYLLAPGFFLDRVREAGADVVAAPLAPDPRLAQIALDRYDEVSAEAAATWSSTVASAGA
ncbi:cobalamin (vitamin B12) biosynthesis CbiX protein [Cellulomonas flavigena DSM 20109]|uniref:Cobalamin (Vitamin B12) biosynthesis CbiX protein n=1 Tax=Cellulomonas flavigena (strain ATCC 482 / DSM 20109 / BCRC 11376 / JCM 18109 / NBRC 3775 / NCIMB 8073 / NRS 134) TaxID=446466 RepID=D5UEL3_CELFN|nr:CbiX/SirB N-terminal domain-containing protein [Cellulomonas flavigena]ADG74673.1 cobalamin (vitamin B12) biosynthesis CbiX protein [Cellulomonas flavigena DSM 20109]